MAILIAATVIVGALCLVDLLLTFGVIRRLREHTELITAANNSSEAFALGIGQRPTEFSAVTTDGELVTGPVGWMAVAVFSTDCSVCPGRVPPFVDYVRKHDISRGRVLAVSVGSPSDEPPYLAQLAEVANVCTEAEDGEIAKAFQVNGFPSFFVLGTDGTVAASQWDPAALPDPARA